MVSSKRYSIEFSSKNANAVVKENFCDMSENIIPEFSGKDYMKIDVLKRISDRYLEKHDAIAVFIERRQ